MGPRNYNGLGDLFVFIFFGLIAVIFTAYVQTGSFLGEAWLAGAAIGALATNILIANNARDYETDRRAGKKTLVVRFGRKFAIAHFGLSLAIAGCVPLIFWRIGYGPAVTTPLLLTPLGIRLFIRFKKTTSPDTIAPILGQSGALLMAYGLLFSLGLILS